MMPMTEHEYAALRVRFGADMEKWPEEEQRKAALFLAQSEGQAFLRTERELDGLFATTRGAGTVPGDADAFMARLMDIPATHAAEKAVPRPGFFVRLFANLPARAAFVSQAAVYVIVLGVGVALGMQQGGEVESDSVDLSAHLFASNADFYLEEE